jgi:hypothetical protein
MTLRTASMALAMTAVCLCDEESSFVFYHLLFLRFSDNNATKLRTKPCHISPKLYHDLQDGLLPRSTVFNSPHWSIFMACKVMLFQVSSLQL